MDHLSSAWHRLPGAPAESLEALRIVFGQNLPNEYTELLLKLIDVPRADA